MNSTSPRVTAMLGLRGIYASYRAMGLGWPLSARSNSGCRADGVTQGRERRRLSSFGCLGSQGLGV
ncbi:hypothetical protein IG631_01189 [Alternaria alternata]|nr:hypothetical protein IG631_01189 [Alternaria alternata]